MHNVHNSVRVQTVPDGIRARWEKWREELHELKICRFYKPDNFGDVKYLVRVSKWAAVKGQIIQLEVCFTAIAILLHSYVWVMFTGWWYRHM